MYANRETAREQRNEQNAEINERIDVLLDKLSGDQLDTFASEITLAVVAGTMADVETTLDKWEGYSND